MSRNLSGKYFQDNKERLQKILLKDIKIVLKTRNKSSNMVVNVTKISQKMKNRSLLNKEKNIIEWEKVL